MEDHVEPQYKYIGFTIALGDPTVSRVQEARCEMLDSVIKEKSHSNKEEDILQAVLHAKKMAVYYGVPGLIHYVNLEIKLIRELLAEDEIVGMQSYNALCYLYLAKCIFEDESGVSPLMDKLLPEENIHALDYWDKKIAVLNQLGDLQYRLTQAAQAGERMFAAPFYRNQHNVKKNNVSSPLSSSNSEEVNEAKPYRATRK